LAKKNQSIYIGLDVVRFMRCNEQYVKQQLTLLASAIGNVIDNNPNVIHITMSEVWEWIHDILGDGWIQ